MGKASVSNITFSLGFGTVPKALFMAPLSVLVSPLAILPQHRSQFSPLAPYCPLSWHPTAWHPSGWHPTISLQLGPFCYPSAGTLLLRVVGSHPLGPVAPLATLLSPRVVSLGYAQLWYCPALGAASNTLDGCKSPAGPLIHG